MHFLRTEFEFCTGLPDGRNVITTDNRRKAITSGVVTIDLNTPLVWTIALQNYYYSGIIIKKCK